MINALLFERPIWFTTEPLEFKEEAQEMEDYTYHRPVLVLESVEFLAPRPGSIVVDATCGGGGHTAEILRTGADVVALDQDPLSLALVRRDWADRGVEVCEGSALGLIRSGREQFGRFDFIYALGLYDYLSDEAGRRLLAAAVEMLNPGGRVWIANFTENLWSSGYMEAVMDWWLVYRSEAQLASMADYIDPSKIASQRVFFEPHRNVAILEVVRM